MRCKVRVGKYKMKQNKPQSLDARPCGRRAGYRAGEHLICQHHATRLLDGIIYGTSDGATLDLRHVKVEKLK